TDGPELHRFHGREQRADPQSVRGVDGLVEPGGRPAVPHRCASGMVAAPDRISVRIAASIRRPSTMVPRRIDTMSSAVVHPGRPWSVKDGTSEIPTTTMTMTRYANHQRKEIGPRFRRSTHSPVTRW